MTLNHPSLSVSGSPCSPAKSPGVEIRRDIKKHRGFILGERIASFGNALRAFRTDHRADPRVFQSFVRFLPVSVFFFFFFF